MAKRLRVVVPDGCGPLVDAIFGKLVQGEGKRTISDIRSDIIEAAAFLDDVDDDTLIEDFDILSEYTWGREAEKIIRKATGRRKRAG